MGYKTAIFASIKKVNTSSIKKQVILPVFLFQVISTYIIYRFFNNFGTYIIKQLKHKKSDKVGIGTSELTV